MEFIMNEYHYDPFVVFNYPDPVRSFIYNVAERRYKQLLEEQNK